MDNKIIISNAGLEVAKDVCHTAAEWAAFAAQVNSATQTALWAGLIIGAVVGAAGLYLGLWYSGNIKK